MPRSFTITSVSDRVNLDGSRRGTTSITVTNSSGKPLRAWPELKELGSTRKEWLALEGAGEKSFSPNESQTFKVTISVPKEASPGKYEFKLNMISGTKGTEEESTEGPAVGFELVPPPPPPPPNRLWLYVVLAVILLGGIAAIFLLLRPAKIEVPDLHGKTFTEASNSLQSLKLTNTVEFQHTTTNPVGTVFAQNPKAKERVSAATPITLFVESAAPPPPSTTVPDFVSQHLTLQDALPRASAAKVYLEVGGTTLNKDPKLMDRIVDQNPGPRASVPQGSPVTVRLGTTNRGRPFVMDPALSRQFELHKSQILIMRGTN